MQNNKNLSCKYLCIFIGIVCLENGMTGTVEGNDNVESQNPFQKAKKQFKTFIASGSKVKLDKHEAVLLDSESDEDRLENPNKRIHGARPENETSSSSKQIGIDMASDMPRSIRTSASIPSAQLQEVKHFRETLASYPIDEKSSTHHSNFHQPIKPQRSTGLWGSTSSSEVSSRVLPSQDNVVLQKIKTKMKRTEAGRVSSVDTAAGSNVNLNYR